MVNRGKEKVRVDMNVVPRSTMCYVHSTLIYTSELILFSIICVQSATQHNIHIRHKVTETAQYGIQIVLKYKVKATKEQTTN